ncbi:hypothetical protein SERLA73DRAFT_120500 [Serpula lacrymans var. lacrymans S7.3]|uniref:Uncharacterized protein n=1 Tax=Serpula lacrymans var. lacrymans (strain S7.3) TaxID=936435 RepID=F8PNX8_SERL3|nr:hypothetical protein SERLA73DRAFT_120500 [Serpula lacrymans var. lacrymans S7.3]
MRTRHTAHPLPAFPVFSSAFLSSNEVVLGGGGGASRSGIKNKLRLYRVDEDRSLHLLNELELEKDEDAPMSMATHLETKTVVCGINSTTEKLQKGQNENCRVFGLSGEEHRLEQLNTKGTLLSGDTEDYQKVTVISPDGSLLVVAGNRELSLLSYPSLLPVAQTINVTEGDIYDATLSSSHFVITTTVNLLVYALPGTSSPTSSQQDERPSEKPSKKKKGKQKSKDKEETVNSSLPALELSLFRFHPSDPSVLYAMLNCTSPRTRSTKSVKRQAYAIKWVVNAHGSEEKAEKSRKAGESGVTCFDVSPDGKFLALGSSNYAINLLDSNTLSPLLTILKAHDFPLTTLCFNPTSKLLVSGSADSTVRVVSVPAWSTVLFIIVALIAILIAITLSK